jgi:HD-GYP domain-containing protein (c-di-GMP phosphodiesterase class II)
MTFPSLPNTAQFELQRWMHDWAELENRLSLVLLKPQQHPTLPGDLAQLHEQLTDFLQQDADATLYWLFQLAASSTVGYSTSHALVCASLCHLVGPALGLTAAQQTPLTCAALTMNLAMTRLQDDLAAQQTPPTPAQRLTIDQHPTLGAQMLQQLGVQDTAWLRIVAHHHDAITPHTDLPSRVLMACDRYAALISPRETRPGRCVTDSARGVIVRNGHGVDEVGHALLRTVGVCPPGTFVRLHDQQVAIVLRRSSQPAAPWVATVMDAAEHPLMEPELVNTAEDGRGVEAALLTRSVRVRLNHAKLLQLSHLAAQRA